MDDRDELLLLARRARERLALYRRAGADGVPRGSLPRRARPAPPGAAEPVPEVIQPVHTAILSVPEVIQPVYTPAPPPAAPSFEPAASLFPPPVAAASSAAKDPRGAAGLRVIRDDLGECTRCGLSRTRKNIVFGSGDPDASLVFVGEGPGETEDLTGEPFVGKAGELLTKMIGAMGFARDEVYICNVVKCRPPGNRNPQPDEIAACEPFLIRQLGAIAPRVVVALGKFAAQTLLRSVAPISALRGNWHRYQGIALMPTFHPAFLLRNPSSKREVWDDLKKVIIELDRLGVPHGPVGRQG